MNCKYTNLQKDLIEQAVLPFIPRNKRGFRSRFDMSEVFKYIVYKLKTGCQWNCKSAQANCLYADIDKYKPPFSSQTVYYYYRKWCKKGVFHKMFKTYLTMQRNKLNTEKLNLDGTQTLVSQHKVRDTKLLKKGGLPIFLL